MTYTLSPSNGAPIEVPSGAEISWHFFAMSSLTKISCVYLVTGGYVCIITREEYVDEVAEYVDRLEPFMKQLVEQGAWTRKERKVVLNHVYGRNGVVFVFRVKQSGAPYVTSTQFTK